jgi:hypothetical protein
MFPDDMLPDKNNTNNRYWDYLRGYGISGRYIGFDEPYNAPVMDSRGNSVFFQGMYAYEDWNGGGIIDDNDVHPISPTGSRAYVGR